ncbi:MAG: dihydroorotate dehydrogenase [Planctomycetota bacterium]|jgi:dihydroorotate dehydrogenase (NAD+) catalytic subunit
MANLEIAIGSLTLKNPVMLASGTAGSADELAPFMKLDAVGAVVSKTVTKDAREGNPPPRTVEVAAGLVNAIGLANEGVDAYLAESLPKLAATGATVVASIAGFADDEWAELAAKVDADDAVKAVELNLSCPNVGVEVLCSQDPGNVTVAVSKARASTAKPLIAKLTPNVTDISVVAKAAAEAGADAITVGNTLQAVVVDWKNKKSRLGALSGGLSGPAIKPHMLFLVQKAARAVSVPVIACGGIMSAEDAMEALCVGASAVQVGTATFVDPGTGLKIAEKLAELLDEAGAKNLSDYVGTFQ